MALNAIKYIPKICLITRCEQDQVQYITQIGTGNYNAQTAAVYTDLSLITASQEIGRDAANFTLKTWGLPISKDSMIHYSLRQ